MENNKKFCTSCGREIAPGCSFCTSCGAPVAATPTAATPNFGATEVLSDPVDFGATEVLSDPVDFGATEVLSENQAVPTPSPAPVYQAPAAPAQAPAPVYQAPAAPAQEPAPVYQVPGAPVASPAPAEKKKVNKKAIIISIVLVIILALGGVGGFFAYSIFSSPFVKLSKGLDKMIKSGKTYTYSIKTDEQYTWDYDGKTETHKNGFSGQADVKIDLENRLIAFDNVKASEYWDDEKDKLTEGVTIKGFVDAKEKKMGFVYIEENDYSYYVYNNYLTTVDLEEPDGEKEYMLLLNQDRYDATMDILNSAMALAAGEKVDEDELVSKIMNFAKPILDANGIDVSGSGKLSDAVSDKNIKSLEKKLKSKLVDQKWLKENFGYEKSKKNGEVTYSFKIDDDSIDALWDLIEDDVDAIVTEAFEYYKKNSPELFEDSDMDAKELCKNISEVVDDLADDLKEDPVTLEFAMEDGIITKIVFERDGGSAVIEIEEASNDISVKTEEYSKYYDEAKKGAKNRDTIDMMIDSRCQMNMYYYIRSAFIEYYNDKNAVPSSINDLKSYFDGEIPTCPWSHTAYKLEVNENDGTFTITCNDPKCGNKGEPCTEQYKTVYNDYYDYDDDYSYDYSEPDYGDESEPAYSDDGYYDYSDSYNDDYYYYD